MSLDQIANMAATVDAEISSSSQDPTAPAKPEPMQEVGPELAAMLQMVVGMAAPALPFLPTCYTPEVCQKIGAAFGAVADKHGWDVRGALGNMGPEVALAFVSIPPTIAAVVLGRAHFAAKRKPPERLESTGPGQHLEEVTAQAGERVMPGS